MKYLSNLILILSILCSCNNNNEPDLEVTLPISETYIPVSMEFNTNSIDDNLKKALIHLVNNRHIINDFSDLPDDPLGFSEAYKNIDFKEKTLLIMYLIHDYSIDTYGNRYYKNTKENTYNWLVSLGTASNIDETSDNLIFTRFAILVKKIPSNAEVITWYGLTQLGWFPEK